MGGQRQYLPGGGFSDYQYRQVDETIVASNGISGKIIARIDETNEGHSGMPQYSSMSEVYLKISDETHRVEQAGIYKDRRLVYQIDWDHSHGGIEKGVAHVHTFDWSRKNPRSKKVTMMSDELISRYGELLKKADPNVKFRP